MTLYEITDLWKEILYYGFMLTDGNDHYRFCRNISLTDRKSKQFMFEIMYKNSSRLNRHYEHIRTRKTIFNIYRKLKSYDHPQQQQVKLLGYDSWTRSLYFELFPRCPGYKLLLLVEYKGEYVVFYTNCEYGSLDKEYWRYDCSFNSYKNLICKYKFIPLILKSDETLSLSYRDYTYWDNPPIATLHSKPKLCYPFEQIDLSYFDQPGIIRTSDFQYNL